MPNIEEYTPSDESWAVKAWTERETISRESVAEIRDVLDGEPAPTETSPRRIDVDPC